MTITLPDEMRDMLEKRAKARGLTSVDEYIEDRLERLWVEEVLANHAKNDGIDPDDPLILNASKTDSPD